jgi:hypothetical protein
MFQEIAEGIICIVGYWQKKIPLTDQSDHTPIHLIFSLTAAT